MKTTVTNRDLKNSLNRLGIPYDMNSLMEHLPERFFMMTQNMSSASTLMMTENTKQIM